LVTNGEASFEGRLGSPEDFAADASLGLVRLQIGDQELASSTPVRMRVGGGRLTIDELRLAGTNGEMSLAGTLPLGDGTLDLEARGGLLLEVLGSTYPAISPSGRLTLVASVSGPWGRPSLTGHAELENGALRFQGFPQALGDVRGTILFDNRTLRFPDIQARFGGAPVSVSGALSFVGLSAESFEARAKGEGLRLRYPEGLVATVDADLQLTGAPSSQLLSGRIDVGDALWSREYDLATGILVSRGTEELDLLDDAASEGALSELRLDVEIAVPGTLRVRSSRASIEARAELQLGGSFARPALVGRVEALRGEVFLMGHDYNLVSGKVEFVDPMSVQPFFDLVAETRVRSYRVELRLAGTPERFFPELTSDPPLRSVDILRLLAGASERDLLDPIGTEEEELAGVGVASLLTERLSQEVGRRAERLFGLDRFSIDPFLVGQFANPTARVSIGKRIHRDVSINYSTNLNVTTETLVLIEYTPEGPVSWIISRDEEGAFGVDLRFRRSF
jgi:translocation and assembly module TamB